MSEHVSRPRTEGEYRVGIDFNPSGNDTVTSIKERAALLIDMCNDIVQGSKEGDYPPEAGRCAALAMTHFEDGAMWAVKAATKRPR